ncbi:ATP-binding protein [Streptomyces sp. NPDC102360]|uniref:ATP-binding protein n=1 Tax=Streptomyces sp. NPDC102360 TaxID=3366160 RepID=UPI0037FE8ADF
MSQNNGAPDGSEGIRTGDVSGTVVIGNNNTVSILEGTLPDPVKRPSISQLPRSTAEPLIGRARDVRTLQEAVTARPLVQIWGASGVGKSALLRHLACSMAHGDDGAAYIEAGGRTADDIAQAIFDISFDAPNYKPSWEVLKEHLKTLRLRIYLDDVGLAEKELRRLVDMAERSTFVFTAQEQSTVDAVHAIRLKGLTAAAAAELVSALLSRELRPDEVPLVDALCDAVDGNPLRLRRIALSAATGKGLPGKADLPELLPALLKKVGPRERDLLHLLGSLSGAELAPRHLNDLLDRTDAGALADGLVRHGLLLASETGYSCPPDVAECVLDTRRTEYPADRLCRTLTAWVEAGDTTADDVAVHFQALDVAVLRAERSGHPRLGVALARAASPKLALSRQFDAWGSLLGVGWAAARSAGVQEDEEFFLHEARTRRKALGRGAMTAALVLEAGVLWHELTALHGQSVAQQVTNAASNAGLPGHALATTPGPVHVPPPLPDPVTTASAGHTTTAAHTARPVFDVSSASTQPHVAAHASAAPPTTPVPQQIDLSSAHTSVAHSTPATSTTTSATGTTTQAAGAGHSATTAAGAAGAKGGASALAAACAIGAAAVLGVGAIVYANNQPTPSPTAAPSAVSTPYLGNDNVPAGDTAPAEATSPSVDPVCATVIPDLSSGLQQYSTDSATASASIDSYNSAMDSYNSGATSTPPDDSTLRSEVGTVISDLRSVESTLQDAVYEAEDSSVESDLDDMLTATQELTSEYESYASDPENSQVDPSSEASAMNAASDSLQTDCGA